MNEGSYTSAIAIGGMIALESCFPPLHLRLSRKRGVTQPRTNLSGAVHYNPSDVLDITSQATNIPKPIMTRFIVILAVPRSVEGFISEPKVIERL